MFPPTVWDRGVESLLWDEYLPFFFGCSVFIPLLISSIFFIPLVRPNSFLQNMSLQKNTVKTVVLPVMFCNVFRNKKLKLSPYTP
jgi:hypothetical protein